jgi:hypothetical protein
MTARSKKALLEGLDGLKLALDPELAEAKREWEEREALERHANAGRRKVRLAPSAFPATRRAAQRLERQY